MKRKRLFISLLIVVFLAIVICAGSNSAKVPSEKCGDCHSDSQIYKDWQISDHAMSLKTLLKESGVYQSCLKCHSASYKRSNPWVSRKDLPTPRTASDPVSCSACHRHDSGIESNLIMTADKLCTTCHILFCGG